MLLAGFSGKISPESSVTADEQVIEQVMITCFDAKATLSSEEFSATCVQVRKLDFENVMQYVHKIETTLPIQMQKVDGKWYIVSGML